MQSGKVEFVFGNISIRIGEKELNKNLSGQIPVVFERAGSHSGGWLGIIKNNT